MLSEQFSIIKQLSKERSTQKNIPQLAIQTVDSPDTSGPCEMLSALSLFFFDSPNYHMLYFNMS